MSTHDTRVDLTLAINDSDQVRDLASGRVAVNGIRLLTMHYEVEEVFYRFTKHREWDVSEMSLGKYCSLVASGDDSVVGIPVFPSRSFRHSGIFIRADGPVDDPSALAGARIGFPEWTVTATVYQRALLAHEYGVDLRSVHWVQGGINEPGRIETLPVGLPEGVSVRAEREQSLNQLLLDGELDAVLVPHPPASFQDGSGAVAQLFSDAISVERGYFERTGIFPIMHLVVLRRDVHDRHPWAGANLVTAFTEAKDRSLARMLDPTAPHYPLPWGAEHARAAAGIFGADFWPYGVESNRLTLETFAQYAHEQALTPYRLTIEEMFPPSVRATHRI